WEGTWKLSAENSMEYYHHIALHAGTVGVQMPARGTYIPTVPATDSTFTHERCRMGEKFIGGPNHPPKPKGDRPGPNHKGQTARDNGYVCPALPPWRRPRT